MERGPERFRDLREPHPSGPQHEPAITTIGSASSTAITTEPTPVSTGRKDSKGFPSGLRDAFTARHIDLEKAKANLDWACWQMCSIMR